MLLKLLYAGLTISLIAVVFTLAMGGRAMVSRDEGDRTRSNNWMWRRVWAQFSAVIFLVLILVVRGQSG